MFRFAFARPSPDPAVFVEKYGSNARSTATASMPTPVSAMTRRMPSRHRRAAFDGHRAAAPASPARRSPRRSSARGRSASGRPAPAAAPAETSTWIATRPPDAVASKHLIDQRADASRRQARRRLGREVRELRGDLPEQPHLPDDRQHALIEDGSERPSAILVHALQVFGRELNGRERILDFVRDLPRHFRPGFELIGARQLRALRGQRLRPCC